MTIIAELLLVTGVLAAGGAWLYWQRRARKRALQPAGRAGHSRARKSDQPFRAVTIALKAGACKAARDQVGQRFLAQEAPSLPLPGCDRPRCVCRYEFHEDRRESGDRRTPIINRIGETLIATGKWRERRPDRRRR